MNPATVCGECQPGAYGPPCVRHHLDAEIEVERKQDA